MSWTRASDRPRIVTRSSRSLGTSVVLALLAHGSSAFAQSTAGDAATAEALFNEARKLSDAGDYASACPKFAESYRLDPGGGTLTALAACHESQGKTASAWAEFIQVASDARQARRGDREKFARQHIAVLEPKLSKLTVVVDPASEGLAGLEIRRDNIVIGRAAWGTALPVDPGDHALEAHAKGKQPWSTHVTVGDTADAQTVTVPALDDTPPETPVVATPPEDTDANKPSKAVADVPPASDASIGSAQRTAGIVVGSVGVALVGLGTYFGVSALSHANTANQVCPPNANNTCAGSEVANGMNEESSAKSAALASDVMFGGAIVALGVGVVLYLTAPRAAQASPLATPAAESSFLPLTFFHGGGAGYTMRW
jgi:hypothetical protein